MSTEEQRSNRCRQDVRRLLDWNDGPIYFKHPINGMSQRRQIDGSQRHARCPLACQWIRRCSDDTGTVQMLDSTRHVEAVTVIGRKLARTVPPSQLPGYALDVWSLAASPALPTVSPSHPGAKTTYTLAFNVSSQLRPLSRPTVQILLHLYCLAIVVVSNIVLLLLPIVPASTDR